MADPPCAGQVYRPLTDLMLDAAVGEIALPDPRSGDWRADLHDLAMRTWAMVKRHRWYAQLVHTRPAGPHMMRRTEFMLTVLTDRGVLLVSAMTYAALVDRHIFGNGLQDAEEHRTRVRYGLRGEEKFLAALTEVRDLAAVDGRCPLQTRWLVEPAVPANDEQFELGLDCLLDGIAARLP